MVDHEIRVLSWVRGSDSDVQSGLLGFLSVAYGSLILDSIVLRVTRDGRHTLSFPTRTDRAGRKHAYIRPCSDPARREIERVILHELGQWDEET